MPGFDTNRIIGSDANIAESLRCDICLLLMNNPIITGCGHTFCYECLRDAIDSGSEECPKCRHRYTIKRHYDVFQSHNTVVIRPNRFHSQHYVFVKNLAANDSIAKLKIRCDFQWKGCQHQVEIGNLDAHLRTCLYRSCDHCGLTAGPPEEHNCLELLKSAVHELRSNFEESDRRLREALAQKANLELANSINLRDRNEWRTKCWDYEQTIRDLKNQVWAHEARLHERSGQSSSALDIYTENVNSVIFGVLATKCLKLEMNRNGLLLKGVTHPSDNSRRDVFIPFDQMQHLKFCSNLSATVLIIDVTDYHMNQINEVLAFALVQRQHIFGVDMRDENTKVIIVLNKKNPNLNKSLTEWSVGQNPKLRPESIDWPHMRAIMERIRPYLEA